MKKYVQCVQNRNENVDVKDTIYAIKNAGYNGVFIQWYNEDWKFSQEEQLKLCKDIGLSIEFAHLGYYNINEIWREGDEGDKLVFRYIRDLDAMKSNNIDLVVIHHSSKYDIPEPTNIGIQRFQAIVDYAEKIGIKVAFENLRKQSFLEAIFDNIKNSNVGVCFDSGHCHCFFHDKFNWKRFHNRIFAIHLHDNDESSDLHLLPFDGKIKWKDLARKLKRANYKGPIVLESCYRYNYLDMDIDQFYALSMERAKKIDL